MVRFLIHFLSGAQPDIPLLWAIIGMNEPEEAISRRLSSSPKADALLRLLHTFRGKEYLVPEIVSWFQDLNLERLRVTRPSKILFLCGGAKATDATRKAENLRDYLLRVRPIKTKHPIVLAEEATQLYRDTNYSDLITFEEDIARISGIVLVIAESPGALAELGAFTTNDTIRGALRVILPSHHEVAESFVRYGPVERLKNEGRDKLGIYPWKTHANGSLNVTSARPHYKEMVSFINGHLDGVAKSSLYQNLGPAALFYVIYWVIHQSMAISPKILNDTVQKILPDSTVSDIRNKIYCMELTKWIQRIPYSGKDYFIALHNEEPFDYVYKTKTAETSTIRRKLITTKGLRQIEKIPSFVMKRAAAVRLVKP